MKPRTVTLILTAIVLGALASGSALAGGGARFGFFIGGPVFWPPFGPWPYGPWPYFPPPVVAVPASPPVFIERGGPAAQQQSFWYWCDESHAYYPYVKECAGGWYPVVPQPVPPPS